LKGTSYTQKDFIDNEPHVEVWDENWDVIELFRLYSRQWRMAMNGPVALDYTVFHHELDRKGVPEDEYDKIVWQLKIVEEQALKLIHRN
jgi:hypothetical protein